MSAISQNQMSAGGQPVTVINNIYNHPPKEESGYQPGGNLYRTLECMTHVMLYSSVAIINGVSQPIYQSSYAVAFVAGAAFGLYKAAHGGSEVGLEDRTKAFIEGDMAKKALMVAEVAIEGPLAIMMLEHVATTDRSIFGGLVVTAWAFSLGADLAKLAYRSLKSNNQKE